MKKLFYSILLIILSGYINFCFAQKWLEMIPINNLKGELSFFDYQKAFDQYSKILKAENEIFGGNVGFQIHCICPK